MSYSLERLASMAPRWAKAYVELKEALVQQGVTVPEAAEVARDVVCGAASIEAEEEAWLTQDPSPLAPGVCPLCGGPRV